MKKKKLPPVQGDELKELKWNMRVSLVPSSVESLYFSYKFKWRYYKLFSILERLALSFVNTLVATIINAIAGTTWVYSELFVIIFNVLIHGGSSLSKLFIRPNTYCFENFLLVVSTFFNFLNSLFALVVFIVQMTVQESSSKTRATQILSICAYVVIASNLLLMVVGLIFSFMIYCKRRWLGSNWASIQMLNFKSIEGTLREQDNTAKAMARSTLNIVINFFMAMAVLCTIGLAIVASVFLIRSTDYYTGRALPSYKLDRPIIDVSNPQIASAEANTIINDFDLKPFIEQSLIGGCNAYYEFEFAGYQSWADFTSQCCCTKHNDIDVRDPESLVEMWRCNNGRKKQRYRALNITAIPGSSQPILVSGLDIRGFCASDFEPGISLQFSVNDCARKYVVPSNTRPWNITIRNPNFWNGTWTQQERQYLTLFHVQFAQLFLW